MPQRDPFAITPSSEEFGCICKALNLLQIDTNARPTHDGMSGGFKYSDEVPQALRSDHNLSLHMVTVLRSLWGYRLSCVRGQPRSDLAPWWEAAKALAPRWPGFDDQRCSKSMLSVAEGCYDTARRLSRDLDSLENR